MSLRPVRTDDVSRFIEPGRGVCVDGDDVDIDRICWLSEVFATDFAGAVTDLLPGVCFTTAVDEALTWV